MIRMNLQVKETDQSHGQNVGLHTLKMTDAGQIYVDPEGGIVITGSLSASNGPYLDNYTVQSFGIGYK